MPLPDLLAEPRRAFDRLLQRVRTAAIIRRHRQRDRATLADLRALPDPAAAPLADALERVARYRRADLPPAVQAIERERVRLLRDRGPLCAGADGLDWDRGRTVREACGASKPPRPAFMLYELARTFGPHTVIEFGTNVGISTAYLATGVGGDGTVITLEASPDRSRIARDLHARLGLTNVRYVPGFFDDTLAGVLAETDRVDLAFIDGNHHEEPTLAYFDAVAAKMGAGGMVVFDDTRWSPGMVAAWREARVHPRVRLALDFGWVGLAVLRGPDEPPAPPPALAPMPSLGV